MPLPDMSLTPDDEQQRFDELLLEKHCDQLIEHFTAVRIIATRYRPEKDDTVRCSRGRGDYYSQCGAVKEWVIIQDAQTRKEA